MKRRLALIFGIVATAVALDQGTKALALNRLAGGRMVEVLPTVELRLTYNSGFSFGAGAGNGQLIAVLVMAVCGFVAVRLWRERQPVAMVLYAAILGGALGNLLDRVFRANDGLLSGKVVDFISVTWYAVFNVADIFVVVGAISLLVFEMRRGAVSEPDESPAAEAEPGA